MTALCHAFKNCWHPTIGYPSFVLSSLLSRLFFFLFVVGQCDMAAWRAAEAAKDAKRKDRHPASQDSAATSVTASLVPPPPPSANRVAGSGGGGSGSGTSSPAPGSLAALEAAKKEQRKRRERLLPPYEMTG